MPKGEQDETDNELSYSVNILLVGAGMHAQRTYLKHVRRIQECGKYDVRVAAVVDITPAKEAVEKRLQKLNIDAPAYFLTPFSGEMPIWVEIKLNQIVAMHSINAVIISTEPLSHKNYILWAIEIGLSFIVDKPITARENAVHSLEAASGLESDAEEIVERYTEASRYKRFCGIVNSHRRWHPAFNYTVNLIEEIRNRFDCPVTSVSSSHCDGLWRFPSEIVEQHYHPFNSGYGKVSHSGYHIIDIQYRLFAAGWSARTRPNRGQVYASFLQLEGYLSQVNRAQYESIFGLDYAGSAIYSDELLAKYGSKFGEIDAKSIISYFDEETLIGQGQIDLRHNGFSRRDWLLPREDLYKGAGRVKHETHEIACGPYQTIFLESRQANDKHEQSDDRDVEIGGNNHFDIKIFRNSGVLGDKAPLQIIKASELEKYDNESLHVEQIKQAPLMELTRFVMGEIEKEEMTSEITDHLVTARTMSSIYKSHIRYKSRESPIVDFNI